jgi:hypothetical protein
MADREELKAQILALLEKSKKPALYLKDMQKKVDGKPREIKNAANELVKEQKAMYWSSGSSTMYALPDRAKDEDKIGV